ncbi:ubiquinol-cytochrome-c reductase complex assembly factor 1-like [Saccoglossus kowalevskii]
MIKYKVPEQTVSLEQKVPSLKRKILDMLGLTGKMRHNRFKMRITGLRIYTSCVSNIDIQTFIKVCNLPDTFFSWFLITQLHVWMCMVRLRKEGKEGKYILHYLVLAMWHDVQQRGTVLGVNSVKMRESLRQMLEIFQGMLFAYDEAAHKTFRVKKKLAKKLKQNRPIPQWVRMRTGNTIRYNAKRRHWRRTKLKL